jgi:hypothetical protein
MKEHVQRAKILCLLYITITLIVSFALTKHILGSLKHSRIIHQCNLKEHRVWQQQMPQV